MNICASNETGIEGETPNAKIAAAVQNIPNTRFWRSARGRRRGIHAIAPATAPSPCAAIRKP